MRHIVIFLFTLLAATMLLKAETPYPELSFRLGGGLSGLNYDVSGGSRQLGFGVQTGAGLTFFFHQNWGVLLGAEWGNYQTEATLNDGAHIISSAVNGYGAPFDWRVDLMGYKEKQTTSNVNIPVALQFQWPVTGTMDVYVLGGMKLGIPLSSTFNASAATITTSGYFPQVDITLTDVPVEGFGVRSKVNGNGDLKFKLSYMAIAEAGVKFYLSDAVHLYAGVYMDYGLNNINDMEPQATILPYKQTNINNYKFENSVLSVNSMVETVQAISFGVNIRLSLPLSPPERNRILLRAKPSKHKYQCNCGQ